MKDFRLIKSLGEGGYGRVYLASKKSNGHKAALKIIKKKKVSKLSDGL